MVDLIVKFDRAGIEFSDVARTNGCVRARLVVSIVLNST